MHHQATGYAHANGRIESFLKKDNSLITNAYEDYSIQLTLQHQIYFLPNPQPRHQLLL
jgi:hypothetical protein